MVKYKTRDEVELIKESAEILGKAHGEIAKMIEPGVKTRQLDERAEEFIRDHCVFRLTKMWSTVSLVSMN